MAPSPNLEMHNKGVYFQRETVKDDGQALGPLGIEEEALLGGEVEWVGVGQVHGVGPMWDQGNAEMAGKR